ncbi:MAG: hypothetical protein EOO01_36225, partial [Chitinophagaceae bacterium]
MKHLVLLILSCILSTFCWGRQQNCLYPIKKIGLDTFQVVVNNYDSANNHENCLPRFIVNARDKPDGVLLVYDGMGRKRILTKYSGGKRIGRQFSWFENGKLESEADWVAGENIRGEYFYPSGKLRGTYVGNPNQKHTTYFENGRIESMN